MLGFDISLRRNIFKFASLLNFDEETVKYFFQNIKFDMSSVKLRANKQFEHSTFKLLTFIVQDVELCVLQIENELMQIEYFHQR